jgi:hypothetical protein
VELAYRLYDESKYAIKEICQMLGKIGFVKRKQSHLLVEKKATPDQSSPCAGTRKHVSGAAGLLTSPMIMKLHQPGTPR